MIRLFIPCFALAVWISAGMLQAQEHPAPSSVCYPAPKEVWRTDVAVGLRLMTVPQDIIEEMMNRAPSVEAQAVMGLPLQFGLRGRVVLQYFTNQFRLGPQWSMRLGDFSAGVGMDAALWFGFVDFESFDNRGNGWLAYPHVSVGYDFGDVRATLGAEGIFLLAQRSFAGDLEVASTKNTIAGGALLAALEQPLWPGSQTVLGVRLAWSKFHYQTWFAFSTFDRPLLFSELFIGVLL